MIFDPKKGGGHFLTPTHPLYIAYFIIVSGHKIKKKIFAKFYCLRQVHLAENLPLYVFFTLFRCWGGGGGGGSQGV